MVCADWSSCPRYLIPLPGRLVGASLSHAESFWAFSIVLREHGRGLRPRSLHGAFLDQIPQAGLTQRQERGQLATSGYVTSNILYVNSSKKCLTGFHIPRDNAAGVAPVEWPAFASCLSAPLCSKRSPSVVPWRGLEGHFRRDMRSVEKSIERCPRPRPKETLAQNPFKTKQEDR